MVNNVISIWLDYVFKQLIMCCKCYSNTISESVSCLLKISILRNALSIIETMKVLYIVHHNIIKYTKYIIDPLYC